MVEIVRVGDHFEVEYLAVDANPATVVVIPVLGDPVVDREPGFEVRGEAASGPSRDAAGPEEGTRHDGEVATRSGHPILQCPLPVQRTGVPSENGVDDCRGRPKVSLRESTRRERIARRGRRQDEQALRGLAQFDRFGRKIVHEVLLLGGQCRERTGIEVRRRLHGASVRPHP